MQDEDIITMLFERSEDAITLLQNRYGKYCYRIAYNILHNREDATEVVNDSYMSVWSRVPPDKPERLSVYIGRITRCAALKRIRAQRTVKRGGGEAALVYEELSECIPEGTGAEDEVDAIELAKLIDKFVQSLSQEERTVFIYRYWYFDSTASVCSRTGYSKSKVKSMLSRTRAKLMVQLKKEGYCNER